MKDATLAKNVIEASPQSSDDFSRENLCLVASKVDRAGFSGSEPVVSTSASDPDRILAAVPDTAAQLSLCGHS